MQADLSRIGRLLLGAIVLWCSTHAHAAEEKPPLDLIEMLGEMEEEDAGWLENIMTKLEQKGRQPDIRADGTGPQEAQHAK